ncbi:neutral zinc metallopeptidase [Kribbella sp. NPDC051936]|uniref:neutral zinc metallopeptidase n=1 Tax=Kribbella sp. NPDC051936 TaxID=3154946 RepID=UPI00342FD3AB
MVNLSRYTLRGVATVGALAGFAAAVMPNAQAAQDSGATSAANTANTAATAVAATPPPVDGVAYAIGNPPAGDGLTTKSSLTNVVRYNRLYKTGAIPSSGCKQLNVSLRTFSGVVAYENNLFKCLYGSWALPLKQAGAAYKVAPTLVVHNSRTVNSYCGAVTDTAFFCGYNGKAWIYIPAYQIINYWNQSPTFAQAYATFTLSHEYGHHVQWLTGILGASWQRQRAFSTYAAQLEESRRRELQASCLGGAVDGANKRNYPFSGGFMTQYNWIISNSGDQPGGVRDHGSLKNHAFWVTAGFNAKHSYTVAGNCNTFNASSAYVA